jgi:hypothetical protein
MLARRPRKPYQSARFCGRAAKIRSSPGTVRRISSAISVLEAPGSLAKSFTRPISLFRLSASRLALPIISTESSRKLKTPSGIRPIFPHLGQGPASLSAMLILVETWTEYPEGNTFPHAWHMAGNIGMRQVCHSLPGRVSLIPQLVRRSGLCDEETTPLGWQVAKVGAPLDVCEKCQRFPGKYRERRGSTRSARLATTAVAPAVVKASCLPGLLA